MKKARHERTQKIYVVDLRVLFYVPYGSTCRRSLKLSNSQEAEGRMVLPRAEGRGVGSCWLKGTEFQFCKVENFWRRKLVTVACWEMEMETSITAFFFPLANLELNQNRIVAVMLHERIPVHKNTLYFGRALLENLIRI